MPWRSAVLASFGVPSSVPAGSDCLARRHRIARRGCGSSAGGRRDNGLQGSTQLKRDCVAGSLNWAHCVQLQFVPLRALGQHLKPAPTTPVTLQTPLAGRFEEIAR